MYMRKILLLAVLMAVTSVQAQRRGCLHSIAMTRSDNSELLPEPYEFDSQKTILRRTTIASLMSRGSTRARGRAVWPTTSATSRQAV